MAHKHEISDTFERGFRKLAGYRAMPALVAALRAHDAQLDRTEGKLDIAQGAA